jgi:membrane fusion protein
MQNRLPLFRPAAVAASRKDALGRIVLARPVGLSALTGVGLLIVASVGSFLVFGTYTAHSTLRGTLVPDRGVIDVRSPQLGTILDKRVAEGSSSKEEMSCSSSRANGTRRRSAPRKRRSAGSSKDAVAASRRRSKTREPWSNSSAGPWTSPR